jgi:hypothetical protein
LYFVSTVDGIMEATLKLHTSYDICNSFFNVNGP